jgi:RNA polymerase sigma-70 factor (ECF subfamily)
MMVAGTAQLGLLASLTTWLAPVFRLGSFHAAFALPAARLSPVSHVSLARRSPMDSPSTRSAPPPDDPSSIAEMRTTPEGAARIRKMVDAEHAVVWRFLRGLGVDAANADDAAQHVFLIAAKRIDAIVVGSERSFLLATARGVAANVRRAQLRSREVLDDSALARQKDGSADPEQAIAAKQARALLDTFLEELPEDVRSVFVLFELEGLTMASIAETLELPPGTVASRLRRAREEFHAAAKRLQAQRGGSR